MIIGVTGLYASGKDTFARVLEEQGFVHISLSNLIREYVREKGMEVTRDSLIMQGNVLRQLYGPGVLAEMALKKMVEGNNYVVSSIRNVGEVEALKRGKEFRLVSLEGPAEIRFDRVRTRNREQDPRIFEEFMRKEGRELRSNDPIVQNLSGVIELAEIKVENKGTFEEFKQNIRNFLENTTRKQKEHKRPSWDEYFMNIAREIGERGTCDRGMCGAVIVKDKRILTTGYVGAPIGLAHCDEAGHLMHEVYDKEGKKSMHCVRTTHAEQNALVQAARSGISVEGGTVYTKMEPCHVCAKMIINAGIKRIVANKRHHAAEISRKIFAEAGVKLEVLNDEIEAYENQ